MRLFMMSLVLVGSSLGPLAQTNAPTPVRVLSMQDCIQLALQHNLDLQIDRYNPVFSLYALRGDFGAYDPTLFISGQYQHNEAGSQLLGGGFSIPGSKSDDDSFSGSLTGQTPWGMTYGLQGNTSDTTGQSFSVNTNGAPIANPFGSSVSSASINVVQPLLKNLWIDSARLNIRVAKNRLQYSELALKLQIMQTVAALEQSYYDLIYDRENVVVQQKAVQLAEQLVVENKKRVEVGALAPLDEQQAEAQAASSQATLIAAKSTLAIQEHLVKQLILDKYSEWADTQLQPSETLTAPRQFFSLQDSWSKGLAQRPELLQAKLDLERAGIQLKFAYNQLYPELDVFATFGYNGSGGVFSESLGDLQTLNRPFYVAGGRITIPLPNTAARNSYKSSKASRQQAVLSVKKMERDIMVQIDNDIKQAQSSYQQVAATKAAREYAAAALDAEQKKLESGKSTTYTVLQMQRDLTTARGNEILALDNYNKALSQLSFDEGSTLQRLSINVEVK
jgi:HAE1 family hydrophobic/amphiphilic exporter-1